MQTAVKNRPSIQIHALKIKWQNDLRACMLKRIGCQPVDHMCAMQSVWAEILTMSNFSFVLLYFIYYPGRWMKSLPSPSVHITLIIMLN